MPGPLHSPLDPPGPGTPGTPAPNGPGDTVDGRESQRQPRPIPAAIGPYRIIRHLGEGGMGTVFEAEQQNPRRHVALKVMRGGSFVDEERVRMFAREIESLARLKHPNIGAIYDAGRTDAGEHFFAMELVRGSTLNDFVWARGTAPDRDEIRFRLRLFQSICDAVHYAHQRGVIHRDLKPSNIIVVSEDDTVPGSVPAVKILDFGLARITEADVNATAVTEIGVLKGTLAYMSPEQTKGDPGEIDLRTDVYSLGVILYEMLTGAAPYNTRSSSIMEVVRTICEESPAPLRSKWRAGRPDADLQTIVGKALEKEAALRYSSAAALSDDIGRYLDSRPIAARAPTTIYQLRKFTRRNRALVGGIVAVFAVLVAGVIVSTTFGLRASAQRRAAEDARRNTEAVVDFQRRMLSDIDAPKMGQDLAASLRERLQSSMREEGESEAAIAKAAAVFDAGLERISTTDVALQVIDQNVLGRALDASDERFADRPMIRAQLRQSIGETYFTLGLLDRAESTLIAAIALYDSLLGADSRPANDARVPLALVYTMQGRPDVAEPLFQEVIAYRARVLGETDSLTLMVRNDLGVVYMDAGRYAAAESLFTTTLAVLRERYGEDDPATLSTLVNYAWLLTEQEDRWAEAESLSVKALAGRRKVLGNQSPETMQSVNNLAVIYNRTGRPELAEPLMEEDYEVSREVLGEEHPDILPTMTNLGKVYIRQGKYDEAVQILEKALATSRKVMPPGFYGTGITLQNYGEALAGLGRDREAEAALVEAYAIMEPVRGADHPGVSACAALLADVYARTGRPGDAALWRSRVKSAS